MCPRAHVTRTTASVPYTSAQDTHTPSRTTYTHTLISCSPRGPGYDVSIYPSHALTAQTGPLSGRTHPLSSLLYVSTLMTDWLTHSKKIPQESIAARPTQNRQMEAEDIGSILKKKKMDNYRELFYGLSGDGWGLVEEGWRKKLCPALRKHFHFIRLQQN